MYNYHLQAFFHVKDEEAFLHFPKAQEVQSFILLVACTTADISLKDCCRLGYSFLSIANPIQPGFILQVKKVAIFHSFILPSHYMYLNTIRFLDVAFASAATSLCGTQDI